jgi:hypothetical protein
LKDSETITVKYYQIPKKKPTPHGKTSCVFIPSPAPGTRKGQNHAVHGFVGAPQASMDGRITECALAGNPAQDVPDWRGAVSFFARGKKDTSG